MTLETFTAWKEKRKLEKQQEAEEALVKSQVNADAKRKMMKGKNSVMNGRALFSYNPDMFKDDENALEQLPEEEVDQDLFAQEEVKEEDDVDFD